MKKKSIKLTAEKFSESVDDTLKFTQSVKMLSDKYKSWCFDLAIIHLYREFENFMLHCLIALINNDSSTLSERQGIDFPRHINVKVCEYLIRGDGYFDFKGRSGLIKKIKQFVPSKPDHDDDHWFLKIVKGCDKNSLNQIITLRNFAAHNSPHAKKSALEYIKKVDKKRKNMSSSSGAWLKARERGQKTGENRFAKICKSLKEMAEDIKSQAPY